MLELVIGVDNSGLPMSQKPKTYFLQEVERLYSESTFTPEKYEQALKEAGIPCTSFQVDDVDKEYQRLVELGVEFSMQPTVAGPVKVAVLDDTFGNNIQLIQEL